MPNSSLGEGVSGGDGARRRWRREREREREQDELQLTLFRVPARKKLFLNRAIEKSFSLETVKDIVDAMLSDASLVLYFQISGHEHGS
uniref:Uncharacterized protein n=1 Tax=Oryza barthii TaxID=65489 RepID=A0A0D3HPW7_9ORYZ